MIAHGGAPGTRWRRPEAIESVQRSEVRLRTFDRPGYPGSTRRPARQVADVVADVEALADAQGWERFAVFGYSGGGPYALSCAALLRHRVTRCAVGAGVAPPHADIGDSRGRQMPPRGEGFRLAAHGESALRPRLEQIAHQIMAAVEAGGPEMIAEPAAPGQHAPTPPRALDDPAAMARLRATVVDSHDGWVDDLLAVVRPWGFDLDTITVAVGIWHGRNDTRVSAAHADWLTAAIPTARRHDHDGGHVATASVHRDMLTWLKG